MPMEIIVSRHQGLLLLPMAQPCDFLWSTEWKWSHASLPRRRHNRKHEIDVYLILFDLLHSDDTIPLGSRTTKIPVWNIQDVVLVGDSYSYSKHYMWTCKPSQSFLGLNTTSCYPFLDLTLFFMLTSSCCSGTTEVCVTCFSEFSPFLFPLKFLMVFCGSNDFPVFLFYTQLPIPWV